MANRKKETILALVTWIKRLLGLKHNVDIWYTDGCI